VITSDLSGGSDRVIDPVTRDYVRTANGEWAETADSRTIMLIALSIRLGRSPFDPSHGTAIGDQIQAGILASPEFLQAETVRVGLELAREGVISDLVVSVRDEQNRPLVDDSGRARVRTQWRDLASGSPIDTNFSR
jgi:hypothetical protein